MRSSHQSRISSRARDARKGLRGFLELPPAETASGDRRKEERKVLVFGNVQDFSSLVLLPSLSVLREG
ncbi:hypothetical protein ACLOJK_022415, partial [Asimina triloba]